jgi:hypothetical protein
MPGFRFSLPRPPDDDGATKGQQPEHDGHTPAPSRPPVTYFCELLSSIHFFAISSE